MVEVVRLVGRARPRGWPAGCARARRSPSRGAGGVVERRLRVSLALGVELVEQAPQLGAELPQVGLVVAHALHEAVGERVALVVAEGEDGVLVGERERGRARPRSAPGTAGGTGGRAGSRRRPGQAAGHRPRGREAQVGEGLPSRVRSGPSSCAMARSAHAFSPLWSEEPSA